MVLSTIKLVIFCNLILKWKLNLVTRDIPSKKSDKP